MRMRCARLLVTAMGCMATVSATCDDARIGQWSSVAGLTSASPTFLIGPVNRVCQDAAISAVSKLPAECAELAAELTSAAGDGCGAIGTLLLGVSLSNGCMCRAAIAFADAGEAAGLITAIPSTTPFNAISGGSFLVLSAAAAAYAATSLIFSKRRRWVVL